MTDLGGNADMCVFSSPDTPKVTAAPPAPTAVTSADVSTDSKRKAAYTARRKSGFADTIVGSSAAALTQQATDAAKKTLG